MEKLHSIETENGDSNVRTLNLTAAPPENSIKGMGMFTRTYLFGIPCIDPSNLNRFHIFLVYCIAVFFTGCTHWGWDGLQGMLYKSGAYAWLCEDATNTSKFGNTDFIDCDARRSTINNLYTISVASQFGFSFCAGTLIDWAGPKICSLLGQFFMLLGWIFLAISSEQIQLYYASLVLIGMAADTAYFPLLNLSNLFPKKESLILGILGSIRSTSFAIPVFMRMIFSSKTFEPHDFWKIIFGYIIIGIIPAILMSIFVIPTRPFVAKRRLNSQNAKVIAEKTAGLLQTNPDIFVTSPSYEGKKTRRRSWRTSQLAEIPNSESIKDLEEGETVQNPRRGSRASILHSGLPVTPSFYGFEATEAAELSNRSVSQLIPFKQLCFSLSYIIIVITFCLNLIRAEFFTKSHKDQLKIESGDVYFLFSICNILSFLPGPMFGAICDYFNVLISIGLMNAAGIGMYAFLMINQLYAKGSAVFLFMVYISFVLSSLYCYVNVSFPVYHFGKLTGIASFIGGMFTLISIPVYSLAALEEGNFVKIDAVMLVCGVIAAVLIFWLYFLDRKSSKVVELSEKNLVKSVVS